MKGPGFPTDGLEYDHGWAAWIWVVDADALAPLAAATGPASGRTSAGADRLDASTESRGFGAEVRELFSQNDGTPDGPGEPRDLFWEP